MTYYLLYDEGGTRYWMGSDIAVGMSLLDVFAHALGRSMVLVRNDARTIATRSEGGKRRDRRRSKWRRG